MCACSVFLSRFKYDSLTLHSRDAIFIFRVKKGMRISKSLSHKKSDACLFSFFKKLLLIRKQKVCLTYNTTEFLFTRRTENVGEAPPDTIVPGQTSFRTTTFAWCVCREKTKCVWPVRAFFKKEKSTKKYELCLTFVFMLAFGLLFFTFPASTWCNPFSFL